MLSYTIGWTRFWGNWKIFRVLVSIQPVIKIASSHPEGPWNSILRAVFVMKGMFWLTRFMFWYMRCRVILQIWANRFVQCNGLHVRSCPLHWREQLVHCPAYSGHWEDHLLQGASSRHVFCHSLCYCPGTRFTLLISFVLSPVPFMTKIVWAACCDGLFLGTCMVGFYMFL